MKVYVLSVGVYSSEYVEGVYASAEAAMAAHPKGKWIKRDESDCWDNGLDFGDAASIAEYEVK